MQRFRLHSLFVLMFFVTGAFSQQQKIEKQNSLVKVNVSVWNEQYQFRTDLSKEDFEIRG